MNDNKNKVTKLPRKHDNHAKKSKQQRQSGKATQITNVTKFMKLAVILIVVMPKIILLPAFYMNLSFILHKTTAKLIVAYQQVDQL